VEKALVAQKVANKLFATEAAVDAATMEAMSLLAGIMEARKEAGVSSIVGDAAASKIAQAISTLADAKSSIAAAHGEMADVKLRLGIRTKLIGVSDKPPGNNEPVTQRVYERNVA
jgi:hypothetical protein